MNFKTYKNTPTYLDPVPLGKEDLNRINTEVISNSILQRSQAVICRENFTMQIENCLFDVNLGDKNFKGEFVVLEKWIYPYLRGGRRFFYPGEDNPIGKYLYILGDKNGNKISQGIHGYTGENFEKGFEQGGGCIRYNKKYSQAIANILHAGSRIKIL